MSVQSGLPRWARLSPVSDRLSCQSRSGDAVSVSGGEGCVVVVMDIGEP